MNTADLISIKDVSRKLGISQNTVRQRVSKGKLPAPDHRESTTLYWEPKTISRFINEQA